MSTEIDVTVSIENSDLKQPIAFMRLVRGYLELGLAEAKAVLDHLADSRVVVLRFHSAEHAASFAELVADLGPTVRCQAVDDSS